MKFRRRGNMLLLTGIAALAVIVFLIAGCTGKTGEAGAPGASVSSEDCDACHHLNSTAVSEFNEAFIPGLAGSDVAIPAASSTTLAFDESKLPEGEIAQSFVWTRTNGQEATINSPPTSSTLVSLPAITNYKFELVRHIKGLLVSSLSGSVLSDRTAIVPVNFLNLDEAYSSTFKLRVGTTSGNYYYSLVKVTDAGGKAVVANFAVVNTGIGNVPVSAPVLIRSKTADTYSWSLTALPVSSASAMVDGSTQFPHFVPDLPGLYTATNAVGGAAITIVAGTWVGAITGRNENGRPLAANCTGCHDGVTAPDKFTPWMNSGHAEILTQNINDPNSPWTIAECAPCHSVGYNPAATNNGFDEVVLSSGWTFTRGNPDNWTDMVTNYAPAAQHANIQCENCHGPNASSLHNNGVFDPERISLSADVCGACHGFPPRWAKFQQWEDSAHGDFAGAVVNNRATDSRCAGCHTAQGFMVMLPQLQAGAPVSEITLGSWNADTAYPVTCAVCHDPHAQGTTSGRPNTARVRVTDATPKLPAGFTATGLGRGAMCIMCHNSRNGNPSLGNGSDAAFNIAPLNQDSFLHQDGDPVFGNLANYTGPHKSNQGDVFMGYNAYFMGNSSYRSPHAQITDTCVNCHMELTPPPALLSYNQGGANHSYRASLKICASCHAVNTSLGPMLQARVRSTLDLLRKSIGEKIISRTTGTAIDSVVDLGERGLINIRYAGSSAVTNINIGSIPGLGIAELGTDNLAKALWNYYLIEQDRSYGVHNPDFILAVVGAAQHAVDDIPDALVPSNEL